MASPVASRRRHDTAGAKNWLTDEGCDGIRAFFLDEGVEIVRTLFDELGFGLLKIVATEIVRRICMYHIRQRQIELVMEGFKAGEGTGHQA